MILKNFDVIRTDIETSLEDYKMIDISNGMATNSGRQKNTGSATFGIKKIQNERHKQRNGQKLWPAKKYSVWHRLE